MTSYTRMFALGTVAIFGLAACETGTASSGAGETRTASAAEGACLAAVLDTTGTGGLSVISTEFSEANTLVMVNVPGAEAPWACYASEDGQVSEVSYTGSEGYL